MKLFEDANTAPELRERLRRMILSGELPPGARLPGARTLSRLCGVHYQTVNRIYHELAEAGFAEIRQGVGAMVLCPDLSQVHFLVLSEKADDNERSHSFYRNEFFDALKEKQAELGIQLDFIEIGTDNASAAREQFERKLPGCDGIVVQFASWKKIADLLFSCRVPVITYFNSSFMPFNVATNDSADTIYRATRHLIENNCKKIGLVVRNLFPSGPNIPKKLLGYINAMRDAGLPVEPDFFWELKGESQFFSAVSQIDELLKMRRLLDGYVCTGSNEGVILASCMRRDGIRIPEQAMIVGYDEIEGCDDITRIVLPRRACAHRCLTWLVEHIGRPVMGDVVFVPSTLHIGNTTVGNGGKK
jgi:DNA-binding LacI/PurR family transcriptional regulator